MRLAASRIIVALAVAAIAAPIASAARPPSIEPLILKAPPTSQSPALHQGEAQARAAHAYSPAHDAQFSTASLGVYARGSLPISDTSPTAKDPRSGFDYAAATIGAGVAAAIVLLATASIVVVRRRGQFQHN